MKALLHRSSRVALAVLFAAATANQVTGQVPQQAPGTPAPKAASLGDPEQDAAAALRDGLRWTSQLELPSRRHEAFCQLAAMQARAVPALVRALRDPRPEVALTAADVLRFLGPSAIRAAADLRAVAAAAEPRVAYGCALALANITFEGTLLVNYQSAEIEILDGRGEVARTLGQGAGVQAGMWDAEILGDNHLLLTSYGRNKLFEVGGNDKEVASFAGQTQVYDADRLVDGTTLVTDSTKNRIVRLDAEGTEIWALDGFKRPVDVERLPSGHILVTDFDAGKVVEYDTSNRLVWELEGLARPMDADRLPNGNTLVALYGGGAVVEFDREGKEVWRRDELQNVQDADRLPNGHTVVAATSFFAEYDASGAEVWRRAGEYTCEITRRVGLR